MKKWRCIICDFVYDETQGLLEAEILPHTPWEKLPDDWQCPDCEAGKHDFELIETSVAN